MIRSPAMIRAAAMIGLAALVPLLALAGCSGLLRSHAPPEQVYYLRSRIAPAEGARPANLSSIRIGRPVPGPGLDSAHIVLLESDRRMGFYTASRWPADLPAVVEELAVEALRESGSWSDVQSSESSFPSEFLLQIRIRRFDADYGSSSAAHAPGGPQVHVILDCTFGRRSVRDVIATFTAEGSAVASANKLGDVVAAFEDAANMALSSVTKHVADAASGAASPAAAASADAPSAAGQKVDSPVTSITR